MYNLVFNIKKKNYFYFNIISQIYIFYDKLIYWLYIYIYIYIYLYTPAYRYIKIE